MSLNPTAMSTTFLIVTALGAAFAAALWLSLMIWTFRDIRSRSRDTLARILAVLVVGVLFLPGIVIYLIVRPAHTLEEEYQRTLEEEALLTAVEETALCPGCSRKIRDDWSICPNCHTRLKKPCHECGRLMDLAWNLCPYCGALAPGMRRESPTMDEALRNLPASGEQSTEDNPDLDSSSLDIPLPERSQTTDPEDERIFGDLRNE